MKPVADEKEPRYVVASTEESEVKLPNISVSSVETWSLCKKAWWYSYVLRRRGEKTATAAGSLLHDCAEAYLKGEDVTGHESWPILKLAVDAGFLPTPQDPEWGVEEWLDYECGPLRFKGKVDFFRIVDNYLRSVDDHKTTGGGKAGPWQYTKLESELAVHPQPLIYTYVLVKSRGLEIPEKVPVRHINYYLAYREDREPKTPLVKEVSAEVEWSRAQEEWKRFERIAQDMYDLYYGTSDVEEVSPCATADGCNAFGGCSHATYCTSYRGWRAIEPVMEERNMGGILEDLAAELFGAPAPIEELPPEAPENEPPLGGIEAAMAGLKPLVELGPVASSIVLLLAKSHGVQPFELTERLGLRNVGGMFVPKPMDDENDNENEETTVTGVMNDACADDQIRAAWTASLVGGKLQYNTAKKIVAEATGLQRITRGRVEMYFADDWCFDGSGDNLIPVKESNDVTKPEVTVEPEVIVEPEVTAEPLVVKAEERPVVQSAGACTVLVDCISDKLVCTNFAEWIRPFECIVEQDGGEIRKVWRENIPHYGLIDYNAGPGRVLTEVKSAIKTAESLPPYLTMSSRHPLADIILAYLETLGTIVIRGYR